MNLLDRIRFGPLIFLHRVKRSLTPPEWRRRAREIRRHINYEIPKTPGQIDIVFIIEDFLRACCAGEGYEEPDPYRKR